MYESELRIRQQSFTNESREIAAYRSSEHIDSATWNTDYRNFIEEKSFHHEYKQVNEQLQKLGFSPSPIEVLFFTRDKQICKDTALPAIIALQGDYNYQLATKIAAIRTIIEPNTYLQAGLNAVSMWGIQENKTLAGAAIGLNALVATGNIIASNKVGTLLGQSLLHSFEPIRENPRLFSRRLKEANFSAKERAKLNSLDSDLYTAELNQVYTRDIEKWSGMVAKTTVFTALNNLPAAAFMLIATGVSEKVGNEFYHESNVVRKVGLSIANSAKKLPYLRKLDKKHINLISKTNSLSRADQVLLACALGFHWNNDYGAFLYGLTNPLSNVLTKHRQQIDAEAAVQLAINAINFINSNDLLLKPPSWKEYTDAHGSEKLENPPIENGVVIHYEVPLSKTTPSKIKPVDITLSGGEIGFLTGKNGLGKTNLLYGIKQIVRPTDDSYMYFVSKNDNNESIGTNVTSLPSSDAITTYIGFVPIGLNEEATLIDHVKGEYNALHGFDAKKKFADENLQIIWEAMINGEDDVVKSSLGPVHNSLYENNEQFKSLIKTYLEDRDIFILKELQQYTIFRNKTGQEPLSELSAGERKLFEAIKLKLQIQANPSIQLALLDEPDSGIHKNDSEGSTTFDDLMNIIRSIAITRRKDDAPPPALLIVTHDKAEYDKKRGDLIYKEISIIEKEEIPLKKQHENVIFSAKN